MANNNSLLELETVRKRLEQLDGERQGLSDLIKKLKQIRDTMTTLQKETDAKKAETEKWLRDLEKMTMSMSASTAEVNKEFTVSIQTFRQNAETLLKGVADSISHLKIKGEGQAQENSNQINQAVTQANNQFAATIQSFRQKAETLLKEMANSTSQLKAIGEEQAKENSNRINQIAVELYNVITNRANELEKQFESFRNKHIESLDQVTKTYHRMKVVYDSMQTTVGAIETSLNNTSKGLNKRVDETNQIMNELRQRLLEEQKAFKEAIQKGLMAQFSKMQKHFDEKIKELSGGLENYLAQKEKSSKQTTRFLWIGIIISFLLGGISTAILLIRMFGK